MNDRRSDPSGSWLRRPEEHPPHGQSPSGPDRPRTLVDEALVDEAGSPQGGNGDPAAVRSGRIQALPDDRAEWDPGDEWQERPDEWDHWDEPDEYWDDDEWVELPRETSLFRRVLIVVGILGVVGVIVAGAALFWLQRQLDPPGPPGEEVEVQIATGSTTDEIGRTLESEGVISNATVWRFYTDYEDVGTFQAGRYVFRANSSMAGAIDVLAAGPLPPESKSITIPEGLTVQQVAERLPDPELGLARWDLGRVNAALTSGEIRSQFQPPGVTTLEGLLFPETYEVGEDSDERAFVQRLVAQMDQTLVELNVEERAAALGLTPYQVVVLASLIEEEALIPEDRAMISRVIHNRLAEGQPLGIDATSRYYAEVVLGGSRDDVDFDADTPYNTRLNAGLPTTPIAIPGRGAIEAALDPTPGDWLWYVRTEPDGGHTFTDTYSEFLAAKEICIERGLGCG